MAPACTVTLEDAATMVSNPSEEADLPSVAELPLPSESTSIPETLLNSGSAMVPVSIRMVSCPDPPASELAATWALLAKENRSSPAPATSVMARVCRISCLNESPSLVPRTEVKPARSAPAPNVTEARPPPGKRRVSIRERLAKRVSENSLEPSPEILRVSLRAPPVRVAVAIEFLEATKRFPCVALPVSRVFAPALPASRVREPL